MSYYEPVLIEDPGPFGDGIPFGLPELSIRKRMEIARSALEWAEERYPYEGGGYLASPEWRQLRLDAFAHYGEACCLCGATERLQVHHRTYAHYRSERLQDLIVLCDDCHRSFHKRRS